ncbi:MAG: sulfatase-like hydrolase/transferase, partial [Rhodospirillaceae bacterium]
VGQIVAALKQAGVYDNTFIIVSSDNGPAPFMRDLIKIHEHNPSGSLRGLKRDLLEGGHRVPFIASWPNRGIKDGRRLDSTLSLTDLFATIAGIIDLPLKDGVAEDSLDILPTLVSDKPVRTELVYHAANGKLGLRQGDWAYLRRGGITEEPQWYQNYWQGDSLEAPALLFDLSKDLAQKTNLQSSNSKRIKRMEKRLAEIEKGKSTR